MRVTKKRRAKGRVKEGLEDGIQRAELDLEKDSRGQGSWGAAEEPGLSVKQFEMVER